MARLLTLVPYLHARGSVRLDEAAAALRVDPDQLLRDLKVLFMCGLPGGYPDDLIDDLKRQYDLSKMTVGLLGMAFKAEIDDVRASLSYKLKRTLLTNAREVLTTDPFVTIDPAIKPLDEVVAKSDLLILCTPHSAYKEADFSGKPVVDIWGFLKNANVVY